MKILQYLFVFGFVGVSFPTLEVLAQGQYPQGFAHTVQFHYRGSNVYRCREFEALQEKVEGLIKPFNRAGSGRVGCNGEWTYSATLNYFFEPRSKKQIQDFVWTIDELRKLKTPLGGLRVLHLPEMVIYFHVSALWAYKGMSRFVKVSERGIIASTLKTVKRYRNQMVRSKLLGKPEKFRDLLRNEFFLVDFMDGDLIQNASVFKIESNTIGLTSSGVRVTGPPFAPMLRDCQEMGC